MNTTFKMARTSLNHSWRFVSNKAKGQFSSLRRLPAVTSQNRRYADRYTFDDQTQAQIQGIKKMKEMSAVPRESPWRDSEWSPDFPERLDELGYESHCNDRLYIAKNKIRHEQQKYELEREERRKQAQRRINSHFAKGQAEPDLLRRRTISQDPADHQRRQEAIIEQNRRRWQNRPESRRETNTSGITYRPVKRKESYIEEGMQRESEDYQRQRRNTESSEEAQDSQTVVYDSNRPTAEWLRKRQEESEAEHWHSWHTCPCSRESETTEEVKPHLKRKKVVGIPPAYPRDYQRRGYHQISPPVYALKAKTIVMIPKRRPSGIDKQYHKFAMKQVALWQQDFDAIQDNGQPLQMPGLVPKKEEEKKPKRKEERRSVEPPRFRMVVKSRAPASRPSTPVFNYSGQMDMPPAIAGPSAYMGSHRKSNGESWRNFLRASSS